MSTPPNRIDELLGIRPRSASDQADIDKAVSLRRSSKPVSGGGSILNVAKDLPKFALSGAQQFVADTGALAEGAGAFLNDPTLEARGRTFRESQEGKIAARTATLSPESQRVAGAGVTDITAFGGDVPTGQFLLGKTAELLPTTFAGGAIGKGIQLATKGGIGLGAGSAVGESLVSAPSGAAQQSRDIDNTSTEQLLQDSSQFKAAFDKNANLSPEAQDAAARSELKGLALPTGALASALSVAAGSALANRAFKGTAGGVFEEAADTAQGVISGVLGGARREAIQEVAQSTLESIAADTVTATFVDPAAAEIDSLIKNAAVSALEGAVLGGTVGGAIGAVQGKLNKDATRKVETAQAIVKQREIAAKKASEGEPTDGDGAPAAEVDPKASKVAARIVKQVLDIPKANSKVDVDSVRSTIQTFSETSPDVFNAVADSLGIASNITPAERLESVQLVIDSQNKDTPDTRNLSAEQRAAREAAAVDANRPPAGLPEGQLSNTDRAVAEVKAAGPRLPKSTRAELEKIAADPDPVSRALALDNVVNRIGESGTNLKGLEAAGILRDNARAEVQLNEGVAADEIAPGIPVENLDASGAIIPQEDVSAKLDPEDVGFDDTGAQTPGVAVAGEIAATNDIPAVVETQNLTAPNVVLQEGEQSPNVADISAVETTLQTEGSAERQAAVGAVADVNNSVIAEQAVEQAQAPVPQDIVLDSKTIAPKALNKLPRKQLNRIFEDQFGGQRGAETNKQLIAKIREVSSTGVLPVDAPTVVTDVGTGQLAALPQAGIPQTAQPTVGRTVAVGTLGNVEISQDSLTVRPVSDLVKIGKKLGVKRNNQSKADFVVALSVADIPADTQTAAPVFTPEPAGSTPNVSSEEIDAIVNSAFPVTESPDIVETPIRTENELVNKNLEPRQVLTTFDDVPITVERINAGGPTSQDLVDAKSESIFGDDLEDISVVLGVDLEGKFKKLETAKKALINALEVDTGSTVRSESSIEKAKQKEENMTAAADALITRARPDQLAQLQEQFAKRPDLVERQLRQEAARPDANLDAALEQISAEIEKANAIPTENAFSVLEDYNSLTDQQAEGISVESLSDETAPTLRASFADTTGGKGMSTAAVRSALSKLTGQGFKRLTVVSDIEKLPGEALLFARQSESGGGKLRGLYVPATANSSDKIFIVANNINSQEEAIFVALHEAVHRGLTKTFGSNIKKVLNAIHDGNANVRARVAARTKADPQTSKAIHIEEVLADMAKDGSARSLNFWNKIVDFFAKWLQSRGVTVPISDAIVEQVVAGAQRVGMTVDIGTMGQDRKAQVASAEFRAFFKDSQITNDDGSPQIMYHGTGADNLVEFRRGEARAIFVTPSTRFASKFAQSASSSTPNIVPTYVAAKNPFDFDNNEHIIQLTGQLIRGLSLAPGSQQSQRVIGRIRSDMDKITDNTESNWLILEDPTIQAAIKALGHDGFFVKEDNTKNLGVYQPEQLKSAIGNRGTFSRVNPDIRASVSPADGPVHTADRVDGVLNNIVKLAESTAPKIKGMLHRKNLYFSTGAHIAEFYGRILGATMGPQVKAAIDTIESANGKASALVNKMNKDTSIIEKEMSALSDKDQNTLYELMGESTRMGIFPNRDFVDQQWLTLNQTPADIAVARKKHAVLAKQYNTNPEVARVYDRALAHNDRDFATAYASILKTMAFSFGAPEAIWKGLDPNLKLSVDPDISASFETGVELAELWMNTQADFQGAEAIVSMQDFRATRGQGPYFHLGRFGNHFIRFKVAANPEAQAAVSAAMTETGQSEASFISENADSVFLRFEHEQQWTQNTEILRSLQEQGHLESMTSGKLEENMNQLDTGSLTFVQNLLGRVETDITLSEDPESLKMTKETIRRLIVEMMPEVTGSKHLARRKNRLGYDLDMRRSFVKRSAANAFMVSHNTTRPEIMSGFNDFRREIKDLEAKPDADLRTVSLATDVLNHLKKRLDNNMSPVHAPITDSLAALGYTMFLAANPPHILANLTQPIQTTLPVLGGRFGFTKTAGAMFKALGVATKILWDTVREGSGNAGWTGILDAHISIDRADLTPGQKQAMNAFIDSGRLEFTQAHGIGRIAQGQNERLNTWSKAMGAASHFSEAINRIVSGLAAYDLELEKAQGSGQSVEDAQATATQFGLTTIAKTQFLYDTENKAYAFSKDGVLGAVTPLATGFQQFNMQMLQLISDLTLQAFTGSPQEQAEAKSAMRGMLATTTMLAGLVGLPFMSIVGAVYDRLGDDDDPNDMRGDMTAWLSNVFGADATNIMMHGAVDKALGGTLSTRVALSDIVPFSRFLEDRRELKDKLDSGALGLLGPSVGAGVNIGLGAAKIVDGDFMKGMIMMLPAGLQGPLKGFDLAQNGFTTGRGDKLPIAASTWDNIIQTLNFSPTVKSELQRNVSSEFVRDRLLNKRKSDLTREFIAALEDGNSDDQQRVGREITAFFVQNPERGAFDIGAAIKGRDTKLAIARITGGIQTSQARAASVINRLQGSLTTNLIERTANGL